MNIMEKIRLTGVVPVAVLEKDEDAVTPAHVTPAETPRSKDLIISSLRIRWLGWHLGTAWPGRHGYVDTNGSSTRKIS